MKYDLTVGAAILAWGVAFGAVESFNVREFGAKGDGVAKDTSARFAPHPVTQAEWTRITGENHSRVKNPDAPVDHVAYQDVVEKFLPKYRRATRRRWDLPTEAERRLSKLPFEGVREWTKDLWDPADKSGGEPIMVILEGDRRDASYAGSITGTDHDGVRLIDRGPLYALPVVPEVTDYAVEAGAEEFVFAGAADEKVDPRLDVASDEGYVLTLAKSGSTLVAKGERGLLWGRETLKQLRGVTVREGVVRDVPKYRIRGAMLDVGRKYYPMTFLDRIVDELARYKMNEFHVHLNDDGGGYAAFRLECETYPGLTAKDGSYTKDEFRAFMKRAAAKGVTVVPEIDAPAHSLCFTKYCPEFASKQYGKNHLDLKAPGLLEFFDRLYGEYLDGDDPVFAGPYLHVGTDEYDKKAAEDFRAFTDAAFRLVRKHGKEPRAWGALTHARGKTPVLADGIIMDIWHNSYFEPYEALAQGYRIVSVPDMWVYIVPNTGYYYDHLDLDGLWNDWEPNVIGRVTVPANHPGLMGGKFALWNDKLGKGVTLQGTWDRMAPAICVLSDKMWKGTCETRSKPLLPESFPFVVSYDAPDNVVSMKHLLDAPAGKDGHVFVKDGNFHTAKGKIRFNATNLTGPANFPSKDCADRMADRMARFGLNCVRLHFLDAPYGYGTFMLPQQKCLLENEDSRTAWTIDPGQFDRLDYLVAALKKRGIYVNVNLHVSRLGGSGIAAAKTSCKGSTWFARELVESEKRYAKDLLTHRNPYTGLTYAEDPAVAMVELNNEDALFSSFQAAVRTGKELPYLDELKKLWGRDWDVSTNRVSEAFLTFLLDTERAYLREMKAYLKDELKVKAPLASTQLTYSPVWSQQELDYLDTHEYWCHPSPVNKNWRVRQDPMVNEPEGNCVAWNTPRKTPVHPMTMSEYNNPYPNYYGAEGQPLMHAYAAFQDWDGIFEYSYDNRVDSEPDSVEYFFSMVARTDVLAHLPACAAMFLRGDVRTARRFVTVPTTEAKWTKDAEAKWNESVGKVTPFDDASHATGGKLPYSEGLLTGIRMDLTGTAKPVDFDALPRPKDGVYVSDTGELRWDVSLKDRGHFTCVTPNVRLFTGFVAGRTFDLGGIALRIGRTANDWATVSFTSKDGNGMDGKKGVSRILLAATGKTLNTGADPENRVWGMGPVRTEGVPAEITLPVSVEAVRVWALGERGERRAPVKVVPSADSAFFRIGPEYRTVWYEVEIGG